MKSFNNVIQFFAVFLIVQSSVYAQQKEGDYFGKSFEVKGTSNKVEVLKKMKSKDTLNLQLEGEIVDVCQAKGCWMKVDLKGGEQVFVRFKDYGFFVPTDSADKSTIINGMAFIEEMSVEDQRHYAEDKGASKEELAKITKPKKTYRFEADGVLIKSK